MMQNSHIGRLLLVGALALAAGTAGASSMQALLSIDDLYDQGRIFMAPDWKPLGKDNNAAVFVHDRFRTVENGYVAAWTDRELAYPDYFEKEKAYLSVRRRTVVDCKTNRFEVTESAYYADHFGGGANVGTRRDEDPEMLDAVPDSIEDKLIQAACASRVKPKARSVHRAVKKGTKSKQ